MSRIDVIKKALLLNNMYESDVTVVATANRQYLIHIFEIVVLLLCNFFLFEGMKQEEKYNFIMNTYNAIVDIIITELEIALLTFENMYKEEVADIIELHNKDECLLVVAIQSKVNKNLEKIKGE